jgi:hypothetical protein
MLDVPAPYLPAQGLMYITLFGQKVLQPLLIGKRRFEARIKFRK